ncbi:MAG TPA: NAD-dependent epimerase/dehydratase family protein [Candidatus Limnocylindrales bacterium]|nr:NAD-dependent epimerase/dehydratase family protein [Candidatus Limnocylindrales bacterium]
MRVVVTGGRGFIGLPVVRRLVGRGDRVVAIVRDPDTAGELADLGVELRRGDLSRTAAIVDAMRGTDGVVHLAGSYRIGIPRRERPTMLDQNLGATNRVLDAAATAGLERIVHVSTVNAFGNTRGKIVDETYRRDVTKGFVSYYDETKYLAHVAARELADSGAPILIAMPGTTYGPDDHSQMGEQLQQAYEGRLRITGMTDVGVSPTHVDDVAAAIVAMLSQGRVGESYILAGRNMRLSEALEIAAKVGGHAAPRITVPMGLIRAVASLGPMGSKLANQPNFAEVVSASDGVTYWASSAKASLKLGYAPRDLEAGIRDSFAGHSWT